MVEIPLTHGRTALVDAADSEWALSRCWCVTNGYPARGGAIDGEAKVWYMHREIAVRAGLLDDYFLDARLTDHINLDKFDNRRSNLRAASYSTSNANRGTWGASGFLGVEQQRSHGRPIQKWCFAVRRDGIRVSKAGFASPEEAAEARGQYILDRWGV